MKRIFLLQLVFLCLVSFGQVKTDKVIFHNGQIAEGKVSQTTDNHIVFTYAGEDFENIISRTAISEVQFGSGRVQQMSEKVEVNSPNDWKNVRLVYDKEEVMGLKSLGQIEKHSSGTWSFSTTGGHFLEKALMKIRKEAAKRGGCIVLVHSQDSNSAGLFKDGNAQITGEVYTY